MTRKLSDLGDFMAFIKKEGYWSQISLKHLRYYIAMEYGTSEYIIKSTIKSLCDFGFLVEDEGSINIFTIKNGLRIKPTPQEQKEDEREAKNSADTLLNKIEGGLVDKNK